MKAAKSLRKKSRRTLPARRHAQSPRMRRSRPAKRTGGGSVYKKGGRRRYPAVQSRESSGKLKGAGLAAALLAGRVCGFAWQGDMSGEQRQPLTGGAGQSRADVNYQGKEGMQLPPSGQEQFRSELYKWFSAKYPAELRPSFSNAYALGLAFREGFAASAGISQSVLGLPVPLSGKASAVVTASNEEKTLGALLSELARLPLAECIVVLNGCTDGSFAEVRKHPGITLVHFPQRLGHDVGRGVGARLASGDSILFLDGDMSVPAEELAAFLYEQEGGLDVVLNDISGFLPPFGSQDEVTRCKQFLNLALGRPDLKSNSLTAVPHVLSRKAVAAIGTQTLAVPPKAQAVAILQQLNIQAPCTADVIGRNRLRQTNSGAGNRVARLIIGDHAEALGEARRRTGPQLLWNSASRAELAKARNGR